MNNDIHIPVFEKISSIDDVDNNHQQNLKVLKEIDYKWRVNNRPWFSYTIGGLLIAQNLIVFIVFIICSFHHGLAEKNQIILSTSIIGVLTETYFTLNIIIKWLFNDIKYE